MRSSLLDESTKTLHQWSCAAARVPCTHTARGCPAVISRSDLSPHLETCPFEAMSAFFIANDARFKEMEEKQRQLTMEVEQMRASLGATRLSGDYATRSAIVLGQSAVEDEIPAGPDRGGSGLAAPRRQPDDPPRSAQPFLPPSTSRPSTAGPTVSGTAASPHSSPRASRRDNESGMTERAAADMTVSRSLFSPSFGSQQSYADRAFHHLSEPVPSTLAALQSSVTRLRHVVMQLASGLDRMERRNEV